MCLENMIIKGSKKKNLIYMTFSSCLLIPIYLALLGLCFCFFSPHTYFYVVCSLFSTRYALGCVNSLYGKCAMPFLNTSEGTAKHLQLSWWTPELWYLFSLSLSISFEQYIFISCSAILTRCLLWAAWFEITKESRSDNGINFRDASENIVGQTVFFLH